jgi:hypothetical protein
MISSDENKSPSFLQGRQATSSPNRHQTRIEGQVQVTYKGIWSLRAPKVMARWKKEQKFQSISGVQIQAETFMLCVAKRLLSQKVACGCTLV